MFKKNSKFIFTSLLLFFLFNASFCLALETTYPDVFGLSLGEDPSFPEYARYFFNIGIMAAGLLAVVVIAWGGIYYLFSLSRGKFTDEGKQWIKAGILGLFLIMSAYLIAYTINPYLVIFDLKGLAPLTFLANLFETPSPSLPIETYSEIPIGRLVEDLVSIRIDCYDFDENGDPIPGNRATNTDGSFLFYYPTFINHDPVDCFLKLTKAVEKKSKIAAKISEEIANLMSQCPCSEPTASCGLGNNIRIDEGLCAPVLNLNECKIGETSQAACEKIEKPCREEGFNCERCPPDIKNMIELGPIPIKDECIENNFKTYQGLKEFRSDFSNNYNQIKIEVEEPWPDMDLIKFKDCGMCEECPVCPLNDARCLEQKQRCEGERNKCERERKQCFRQTEQDFPWYYLTIIDQITYLKGRIEDIKTKIEERLKGLEIGERDLGKCYLADSYIDFLKIYEQTSKQDKIIVIDGARWPIYCEGFQYFNSTCYSQCQKQCPGTTAEDFACYREASSCVNITDFTAKQECLKEQAGVIEQCYKNRACIENLSPFGTFPECIVHCKLQCLDDCQKNFCSSTVEAEKCKKTCMVDSNCLIKNAGSCLVNFNAIADCSKPDSCKNACNGNEECIKSCEIKYNNLDFKKNCVENSARTCAYCSDQNAGYPECVRELYYSKELYSSPFIYKNPGSQICANPNRVISGATTCQSQNPETAKCPSASNCPDCPCGIIYKYIEIGDSSGGGTCPNGTCLGSYGVCSPGNCQGEECPPGECLGLDGVCSAGNCNNNNTESVGANFYSTANTGVNIGANINVLLLESEYRACNSNCDNSAVNDDPLTFYCNQTWWKKQEADSQKPLGESFTCEKEQEIPIGNAVDEAEKWAQNFINIIKEFVGKTENLRDYLKKIGEEINYCKCTSDCGGGEKICLSKCEYIEYQSEDPEEEPPPPECKPKQICVGNSCQKMINFLIGMQAGNQLTGNNPDSCPKNAQTYPDPNSGEPLVSGFEGVKKFSEWISLEINNAKAKADENILILTDALKKLGYSRKMINTCGQNYLKGTRMLSCTRVQDEIIPPIIGATKPGSAIIKGERVGSYCYGKEVGTITGAGKDGKEVGELADNWFCCQSK